MIDIVESSEVTKLKKVYKLIQEYQRFNLYEVYLVDTKTNKERFVYRETKARNDFGKILQSKQDMLNLVNNKLKLYGDRNGLSK